MNEARPCVQSATGPLTRQYSTSTTRPDMGGDATEILLHTSGAPHRAIGSARVRRARLSTAREIRRAPREPGGDPRGRAWRQEAILELPPQRPPALDQYKLNGSAVASSGGSLDGLLPPLSETSRAIECLDISSRRDEHRRLDGVFEGVPPRRATTVAHDPTVRGSDDFAHERGSRAAGGVRGPGRSPVDSKGPPSRRSRT